MYLEFKQGRKLYFGIYLIFVLLAVKLFVPIHIGGLDLTRLPLFFFIENRALRVIAIIVTLLVGHYVASGIAARSSNREFDRLVTMLHFNCQSEEFLKEFAPVAQTNASSLNIGLAKSLLYIQGLYAAGKYQDAIAEGEKMLNISMGKGRSSDYLTRCAICQYLILSYCDSGDTAKAAATFRELEYSVTGTEGNTENVQKANRIKRYTHSYISYTVNPEYRSFEIVEDELFQCDNNFEKVQMSYLLGQLYFRSKKIENARSCLSYTANHQGDFVVIKKAQEALAKLPPKPEDAAPQA